MINFIANVAWKFKSGILAFLVIILIVGWSKSCQDSNDHIEALQKSIATSGTGYVDMSLTSGEIKEELKKPSNQTTDSLLKKSGVKSSQVESINTTSVKISNKDTTTVANADTLKSRLSEKTDSLYKTPFSDSRNCIKIAGYVLSTDKYPAVVITSQSADIDTYDIVYHRKWWQIFSKKVKVITYTKCGNLQVVKIKNTDKK